MKTLSGPSIKAKNQDNPKNLVILMHGIGADGNDLIGLASNWSHNMPDTEFLSPNAPFTCNMSGTGYQWFGFVDKDLVRIRAEVSQVALILNNFIDDQLKIRNLNDTNLALVGFSQGAMLALHVGLRRKKKCAGIVGYSGMLLDPDNLQNEVKSKPPIALVHGDIDPVITPLSLPKAETKLKNLEIPVETHMREGLGHGIDAEGVEIGKTFLHKNLQS